MQEDVLAGPMRVPQLQRRRSNLMALESTLELVARVQQSQAAIEVTAVTMHIKYMKYVCHVPGRMHSLVVPICTRARG